MPTILDTLRTPVSTGDSGFLSPDASASGPDAQVHLDSLGWAVVSGLDFARAQETLDWLENHGVCQREMVLATDGTLTIRWIA